MGKGDTYRPSQISREEEELRWKYAMTDMTFTEFRKRYLQLMKEGKITRNGKVIKHA